MALSEPATDNDETEIELEQKETVIEIDSEEQVPTPQEPPRCNQSDPDLSCTDSFEMPYPLSTRFHQFPPAVYQSSATLLSSLIFPPYEFVHCDLDDDPDDPDEPEDLDDPDDCQITGEYQQPEELSSSSDEVVQT